MQRHLIVAVLASLGCWVPGTLADIVELRPAADTSVFEAAPAANLGTSLTLAVGGNGKKQPGRGLLRFDLAGAVPAGASVVSVSLAIQVMKDPGSAPPSTFLLRRMRVPWAEGRGDGNLGEAAVAGEPTWNRRVHPDVPWSAPGGGAGVDFEETPSANLPMLGTGRYVMTSDGLKADVARWLADPSTNFGWMMMNDLETTAFTARRIATREDPAFAPVLMVEYSTPGAPAPRLIRWGVVDGRFEIEFQGEAGNVYEVQSWNPEQGLGIWTTDSRHTVKLAPERIVVSYDISEPRARLVRIADVGDVD